MTLRAKFALSLSLIFAAGFLSGCRTLQAPSNSGETWRPSGNIQEVLEAPDSSWSSLRDQKIDSEKRLTLIELADIALRNNPSTKQAWANARVAEAAQKIAQSSYYPQATVSGLATRLDYDANQPAADADELKYGPEFKINYLLLDFGGRSATAEQALQLTLAANLQFNRSIQDVLYGIGKSYYELYSAHSNLKSTKADIRNARATMKAAEEKLKAGLVSKLDLLQAQSNYYESLVNFEAALGQLKAAKANLNQTLGIPADTKIKIAYPAKDIPTQISEFDVSSLIEEALKKRPDIAALRAQVRADESAVKAANSALWPTLNAQGIVGANWYEYYGDALPKDDDQQYAVAVGVNWDIFTGFQNISNKRKAQAQLEADRHNLLQSQIQVSAEVWTKYFNFKTAIQRLSFSQSYLETSQASYDLALEGYNAGLKNMLDLLQAYSDLSDARSKLILTRKDLFVALVDLAHAIGALNTDNRLAYETAVKISEKKPQS